ncbi:DddA-like double-stranded DNA deaminase toxin [Amycolatopsis palatopharyngis]|uniref:DddA-like double-stranded DNA deaminase toxin n=1 Tax=Amycolatopsis palatopharyngis TaxID=187982 RepID=UPI000E24B02A|nr:DddA-like double-stranded DNA deaminase toxin [Amycolatopsis palatopharyngis]
MSVTDLASGVEHALARIGAARDALTAAGGSLDEAHELWSPMVEGSHDEVQQVPLRAEQARLGSDKVYATLNTVEQLLRGYLNSLGVTTAPDASAPAGSPLLADPGAPARPPSIGPTRRPTSTLVTEERLRAARRRVGSRPDGTPTHGEWVRSDGWSVRIISGPGDEHFHTAATQLADLGLPRPVSRLATHVEVKVAARMREDGLPDETVVIDRSVCGTRPFDVHRQYTCDRYLSRILPPGARLRVVQPDGTIRQYEGEVKL